LRPCLFSSGVDEPFYRSPPADARAVSTTFRIGVKSALSPMMRVMPRLAKSLLIIKPTARGEVELVCGADHFSRIVRGGILTATTSIDIATADFKAMLVPDASGGRAVSIVQVFRRLARKGVEIRLLHSGVPSGPTLQELKRELPDRITIRRCQRLHAKIVIVDCAWMYLGSANLTGAGLGAKSARRRNFEMGACTRALPLIDAALEEFNAIWEGRHCEDCGRRNLCPVPLEEPSL
jgi:phosphatidylserine/phosphatidylglycerophosphate/cardiolipin synthase-like enzyme